MDREMFGDTKNQNKNVGLKPNLQAYHIGLAVAVFLPVLLRIFSKYLKPMSDTIYINSNTMISFNEYTENIGSIIGKTLIVLSILIYTLLFRIIIKKRIQKKYPGEKIICMTSIVFLFMVFVQYIIGMICGEIISAIIFFKLLPSKEMAYIALTIFIIMILIAFIAIFIAQYSAVVLTNKRIVTVDFWDFVNKNRKGIILKDIKRINKFNIIYEVVSKNDEAFPIAIFYKNNVYRKLVDMLELEYRGN